MAAEGQVWDRTKKAAPEDLIREVAGSFGLGPPRSIWPLGGTAAPKYAVEVPRGRFVIRVRPLEFSDEKLIRFDHESLLRLAAAGLPVPCPQRQADGRTWLPMAGRAIEVFSWVEGEPFVPGDLEAVRNVGRFVAAFHTALGDDLPCGKEGVPREDHPDLLAPYVRQLDAWCVSGQERAQIHRVGQQLDIVRQNLDQRLWPQLPRAMIHGDLHPGNVRFRDSRVAAVYDFDYLKVQPRVRDVGDALMFFAARRDAPVDPDDIVSLTQPFELEEEPARILIAGYEEVARLSEPEWEALPLVIRSIWAQIRLRGSRKVPRERKVQYVLHRFFEVVDWLDRTGAVFFHRLRQS